MYLDHVMLWMTKHSMPTLTFKIDAEDMRHNRCHELHGMCCTTRKYTKALLQLFGYCVVNADMVNTLHILLPEPTSYYTIQSDKLEHANRGQSFCHFILCCGILE